MNEELYAGYLCATHIGQTLRIGGVVGLCRFIGYTTDRPTVHVVLLERGESREDGSVRKRAHDMRVDPREIVEVVET